MTPFTIALPAGRLAEESIDFFHKAKLARFDLASVGRELSLLDAEQRYRLILVRNQDVPTYVLQGGADVGITGRDVMAERGYDLTLPMELSFGRCRLSVAVRSKDGLSILKRSHLRVATKYPGLTMAHFFRKGISCEIIKLYGSIEIAPDLGLADCIVDLVSTGGTLKANGLIEAEVIMESSAVIVANRSVYARKSEQFREMIQRFSAQLNG